MLLSICVIRRNIFHIGKNTAPVNIEINDGRTLKFDCVGSVLHKLNVLQTVMNCTLENVLFVPNLAYKLVSIFQASQEGKVINFWKKSCKSFNKQNKLLAVWNKVGKLCQLNCFRNTATKTAVSSNQVLLHRRFCHLGMNNLRKLVTNDLVKGVVCSITNESFVWENCCDCKKHIVPFQTSERRSNLKSLELIHRDVCDKIN